jgi:hypothetical protein
MVIRETWTIPVHDGQAINGVVSPGPTLLSLLQRDDGAPDALIKHLQPNPTCKTALINPSSTLLSLLQGGTEQPEALIKHLQLNPNLYCGVGGEESAGGKVLLCDEGYLHTPNTDVESPGSPARDHIMQKLLKKVHPPSAHMSARIDGVM